MEIIKYANAISGGRRVTAFTSNAAKVPNLIDTRPRFDGDTPQGFARAFDSAD